jgi:hypothetical protein
LLQQYFGNYERVLLISQRPDPALVAHAEECADRLGLRFDHRYVGYGDVSPALISIGHPASDTA